MQVIYLLTVIFYRIWFYVLCSSWCQYVFVREDKHNILVLSKCTPIFISLLLKRVAHKEMVHFCCMEMGENQGRIHLISMIGKHVPKPSHFPVIS